MIDGRRTLRGPQLYSDSDIAALSGAALRARRVLDALLAMTEVEVKPREFERECRSRLASIGALPIMADIALPGGTPFGDACSVGIDDTVAHARPGHDPFERGQLVTVDLMLALDGWHADVADSTIVGGGGHPLLHALDAVWEAGLAAIGPGVGWNTVAGAMGAAAQAHGARMVRGLAGHGIGLAPHELPVLPLAPGSADPDVILRPGMVFTLEPAVTSGSGETVDSEDGWAILTADGAPAVGREAVIAMLEDGFRVLGGPAADDS